MDSDSLKRFIKDLQGAQAENNSQTIIAILNRLKGTAVTEELLRETKAGVAVGKLRSNPAREVSELAKEIVKTWKGQVDLAKERKRVASGASSTVGSAAATPVPNETAPPKPVKKISTNTSLPPSKNSAVPSRSPSASTPTASTPQATSSSNLATNDAKSGPSMPSQMRSVKVDGVSIPTLGDKTRDKCAEMAYDAMVFDSYLPTSHVLAKALDIEKTVYKEFGSINNDYRTKMRRLILNLKEKNNPGLRRDVLGGQLLVERFCTMTAQEMASEERQRANALIESENLHNSLGAAEQEAETDAFKCGRCKQRKTRYRQAQTRSADEPMTTFVTCVNCGNRWKFS